MAARKPKTKEIEEVEEVIGVATGEIFDASRISKTFEDDDVDDAGDYALMRAAHELGEDGDGVRVHVHWLNTDHELEECFSCHPDEFTIDRIRDEWGPGKYRIYGRKHGAIKFNRKIILKKPLERSLQQQGPNISAVMGEFAEKMMRQQEAMFSSVKDLVLGAITRQVVTPPDPVLLQKSMLDNMVTMKQFLAPAAAPATSDPVALLLQGIKLAQDLTPRDGGGDSGVADVVLEAIRTFGQPIVEASKNQTAGGMQTLPGGFPVETPVAAGNPQTQQGAPMMIVLKQQLAMLVRQAKQNKTPSLYAELVLDNMPVSMVENFIGRADAIEQMIAINPEVAMVRPWFEQLRAEILDLLSQGEVEEGGEAENLTPGPIPVDHSAQNMGNGAANVSRPTESRAENTDDAAGNPVG